MMKRYSFVVLASILFLVPLFRTAAQTGPVLASVSFDMTGFPQWSKDMRRWEIVAFGTFPFSFFFTTFAMDMYRWNTQAGMNWSSDGLRYAPWPLKGAGAIEMSNNQREITLIAAAGISAAVAFVDLIIVKVKRDKERKRIENMGPGTAIIIRRPYTEFDQEHYFTPDTDFDDHFSGSSFPPVFDFSQTVP
jgi:hypothetical protein